MALDTSKQAPQAVGNYQILERIAEGGMGTVYRARDSQTGQIVAVKIVPSNMASNAVFVKRFEQEFRAAQLLEHPNMVRALDFGYANGVPYMVMEFVEGESLGQRIERDGRLPEAEALRLISQVAQALHRAHKQGLIHRDVKPDNIMVTPDGQAKLADLGLVKEVDAALNLTRTGRGLGTPHFMPPEQFRNAKNADVRCDIYAMAATLYMMVTGELPFKSNGPLDAWMKKIHNELTPPRSLVPTLSVQTDQAIRRAMHSDPNQRPATCKEFVEDLSGQGGRKPASGGQIQSLSQDLWYLVYKDEEGLTHTVKGSTEAIRRSLTEGRLGDAGNVRASRSKSGTFELLTNYAEFQDVAVGTAPANASGRGNVSGIVPTNSLPIRPGTQGPMAPAPHISIEPTSRRPAHGPDRWNLLLGLVLVALIVTMVVTFWLTGPK